MAFVLTFPRLLMWLNDVCLEPIQFGHISNGLCVDLSTVHNSV
ncbi:hypothetical protein CCACVL1_05890 [Corchorus capsularis]|uniref:Uncharacterized protein n=1 Tax=Corchorus capsularis TaxID=210143 RepID=A0A1R3JIQ0_COCAP|nr:hypothetical protein CCACVL1_05890 [Corchorus capsularis]